MCGLCGFGLADAELVLGRDVSNKQHTEQTTVQSANDTDRNVVQPVLQIPTSGEGVAGPARPDGLVATLWARFKLVLSGHPSATGVAKTRRRRSLKVA